MMAAVRLRGRWTPRPGEKPGQPWLHPHWQTVGPLHPAPSPPFQGPDAGWARLMGDLKATPHWAERLRA